MSTSLRGKKQVHSAVEPAVPLYSRLHRIGGQVAAVERMMAEGRDCYDVLQQIVAAREALDRMAIQIVHAEARGCLQRSQRGSVQKDFERLVNTLFRIVK
ncbi:MAG: metal-sensitive transcriptional regulator [Patescibacteria group bacterium]